MLPGFNKGGLGTKPTTTNLAACNIPVCNAALNKEKRQGKHIFESSSADAFQSQVTDHGFKKKT